jgi:hypothetical protein
MMMMMIIRRVIIIIIYIKKREDKGRCNDREEGRSTRKKDEQLAHNKSINEKKNKPRKPNEKINEEQQQQPITKTIIQMKEKKISLKYIDI